MWPSDHTDNQTFLSYSLTENKILDNLRLIQKLEVFSYELLVSRRKHSLACMMQFFNKSSIGENITAPLVKLDHVEKSVAQKFTNPLRHDILAVQLATDLEKLFQRSCKTLDVDIIYLDMTERLPFYLKFPTVNAAIERGIHFEFGGYSSSAIRDSSLRLWTWLFLQKERTLLF